MRLKKGVSDDSNLMLTLMTGEFELNHKKMEL